MKTNNEEDFRVSIKMYDSMKTNKSLLHRMKKWVFRYKYVFAYIIDFSCFERDCMPTVLPFAYYWGRLN